MSQYINFYIKSKKSGEFISLDSYSRNNAVYEYGHEFVRYEKGIMLTSEIVKKIMTNISEEDKHYNTYIQKANEQKALIASMNNSIDDKIEAIHNVDEAVNEYNQVHDDLIYAFNFYKVIYNIIDAATYSNYAGEIWCGIEWDPNYKEDIL